MSNKEKSVVSFLIDDTPSAEQASKTFHDDYELNFQDFLERTVDENTAEDFSYSNNGVKKAGRRLRKKEGDLKAATATIQQFRAAHEKPLNTIAYLVGRCCRELGIDVKPVTRLKRLETIIDKLQRKSLDGNTANATCVTNMNDIGGCRAIFPDLMSLELAISQLQGTVEKVGRVRIKDIDNYITNPKPNDCGYRSLHVIYRYDHASGKSFNIEAQLRTRLQHLWATTVEIVDILEGTKIKTHSHSANEDKGALQIKWEELLSNMSRYIADAEGAVELGKEEKAQLSIRLRELNDEINALGRLETFKILSEKVKSCSNNRVSHVLLVIDENALEQIFNAEFDNYSQAISAYNALENATRSEPKINTLLISTSDIGQLSEAYPNYLGDCASFMLLLQEAMQFSGS
ncbi:putative GTP pyrophosphokinase [Vibrio crassostreae]|nr:RelA_SpoT domain-containing protein [Vibrio chagasii]CAK3226120.1 putative GTP pyrophosphokinase [Vibrio crassostreae]